MSRLFISGGQSFGASAAVLPMNIQGWFPLGLTGLISLQSKGHSRVFSSTTVQKHQFLGTFIYLIPFKLLRLCCAIWPKYSSMAHENTSATLHTHAPGAQDGLNSSYVLRWSSLCQEYKSCPECKNGGKERQYGTQVLSILVELKLPNSKFQFCPRRWGVYDTAWSGCQHPRILAEK